MMRIWHWLRTEAEEAARREARGLPDVLVDRQGGAADTTSDEGRLRLATLEARSAMRREAIHCLRLIDGPPPPDAEAIAVFLQDPHDPLVLETLSALGAWRVETALPTLLALYRMYPTRDTWNEAFDDPTGRGAERFAHPGKRRPRPAVHDALRAALEAITGRTFEAPASLAAWLARTTAEAEERSPTGVCPSARGWRRWVRRVVGPRAPAPDWGRLPSRRWNESGGIV